MQKKKKKRNNLSVEGENKLPGEDKRNIPCFGQWKMKQEFTRQENGIRAFQRQNQFVL